MKRIYTFLIIFLFIVAYPKTINAITLEEALTIELEKMKENNVGSGTYLITISYDENGVNLSKTIAMTITSETTVIVDKEAIDASNISLSIDQVNSYSENDYLVATKARAWSTKDGSSLPITKIDISNIKPKVGTYLITIGTEKVSMNIGIMVIDNIVSTNNIKNNNEIGKLKQDKYQVEFDNNKDFGYHENLYGKNIINYINNNPLIVLLFNTFIIVLFISPIMIVFWNYIFTLNLYRMVNDLLKKSVK